MKVFTVLATVVFATLAVAGPMQGLGEGENRVEKEQECPNGWVYT